MKRYLSIWLILMLVAGRAHATDDIRDFLKTLFSDNNQYVTDLSHEDLKTYIDTQMPRATVVSCSDSRVQTNAYHKSPENDLFFIRNIGNQVQSTEGSIEYGINHLKTPILLIIGHTHCGAVQAALGDYSKESKAIKRELNHMRLAKKTDELQAVVENVHHQVEYALEKFKDKVAKKELVVIGTVYDFRDDFKQGHGRLVLVNINGEKNKDKLKQNDYLKNNSEVLFP